jgi:hypothetical protein
MISDLIYGDGRTNEPNRVRGQQLLRFLQEVLGALTKRGNREFSGGNFVFRIKSTGARHLSGKSAFWGAIRPKVNAEFIRRCQAEKRVAVWVFEAPTGKDGVGHMWLLAATEIAPIIETWQAEFGSIQEQFHVHIRSRHDDSSFVMVGSNERKDLDLTERRMTFPIV